MNGLTQELFPGMLIQDASQGNHVSLFHALQRTVPFLLVKTDLIMGLELQSEWFEH